MNTIRGRLITILLVTQAALVLPLLYMISRTVEFTMSDAFIDDARSYAHVFAAGFASPDVLADPRAVVDLLDTAILGGHCIYAALSANGETVHSSLMSDEDVADFREDFEFGDNGDSNYYLSLPITGPNYMAILQLGFDESAVTTSLATIRSRILYVLLAFLGLSIALTAVVSSSIVNPLRWLQRASRSISSGETSRELRSASNLVEIRDLSNDLETMRRNLVGMAERVQQEMHERELAEAERRGLEGFLRQAQRLESLGTLAGGVAHEFNNVLQPILLYTELALEDVAAGSPTAINLVHVRDLARRASGLTRQILTFGRQEEHAEFRHCDIRQVVFEAVTMIRALLPATVDIRTRIGADIGNVNCDPAQIRQLVVNLCTNAFNALDSREDFIEISLQEVLATESTQTPNGKLIPGEYVVLQVADSGRGMDEETMEHIFEPFFTTREIGEGTGLGLSVVHGIVMRHDGEITVESEPGEGSRFRIYLPLADEPGQEPRKKRDANGEDTGN